MPVLTDWSVHPTVEDVIRTQHMDVEVIRRRRPVFLEIAAEAIRLAESLCKPKIVFQRLPVERIIVDGIILQGGLSLTSSFLAKQLAGAEEVIAAVCTISSDVEKRASELMANNKSVEGYALESASLVALGQVNDQFYASLEASARSLETKISHRYSPGLPSWSVAEGQPEIFAIIENINTTVQLCENMQMIPMKSISYVVGIGKQLVRKGSECGFCGLRDHCTFRSMHDSQTVESVCQQ
ncbi:MAG: hypothetical protein P4L50_19780 [Anaerolineaceae bacterium]|nr:hypothetical protein [Anaerolineaceae bacterium]